MEYDIKLYFANQSGNPNVQYIKRKRVGKSIIILSRSISEDFFRIFSIICHINTYNPSNTGSGNRLKKTLASLLFPIFFIGYNND